MPGRSGSALPGGPARGGAPPPAARGCRRGDARMRRLSQDRRRRHVPPFAHRRPGRPGGLGGHRRREPAPGRPHRADRVGELREPGRDGGAGLAAHEQVRGGLSGQALLRRLRARRCRRAAGDRPGEEALRRRLRQRPAAFGRAGQPGRLLRRAEAGRHDPRHEPAARRAPDARLAGQHQRQVVQRRRLRPPSGDRAHRLRRRRAAGAPAQAEAHHRRRVGVFARDRLEALPRDRRRRGRAADGGHGALRRPGRGRRLPDARRHRRFRDQHHAQDAARTARRPDPRQRRARRRPSIPRSSRDCRAGR